MFVQRFGELSKYFGTEVWRTYGAFNPVLIQGYGCSANRNPLQDIDPNQLVDMVHEQLLFRHSRY